MATAVEPATYWCHQCHTSVRPTTGSDILCPFCNGGFIEEIENAPGVYFPPARQRSTVVFGGEQGNRGTPEGDRQPALFHVLQAMSAILQQGVRQEPQTGDTHREPEVDPMLLVQNMFGGHGGRNVEVFFDTGGNTGPRRLPANFGDYFFGPGLDQLIQQLAENDPNRYGTPPAAKAAIEAMPTVEITTEHMTGDASQCAVCKDEFEIGTQVKQMPCKHLYHEDCIMPWLTQHNSCPVCRHEMPTDDPDYDQLRRTRGAGGSNGPRMPRGFTLWGGNNTSDTQQQEGPRRPPIRGPMFSFPWPLMRSSSSSPNGADRERHGDSDDGTQGPSEPSSS